MRRGELAVARPELLYLIASPSTAAQAWAGTVDMPELRVSVTSIAQARARIQFLTVSIGRQRADPDVGA